MIRVYSANFTKEDYKNLATVFFNGLRSIAPGSRCKLAYSCSNCEYHRICSALMHAIDYCDKQCDQMVEP